MILLICYQFFIFKPAFKINCTVSFYFYVLHSVNPVCLVHKVKVNLLNIHVADNCLLFLSFKLLNLESQ